MPGQVLLTKQGAFDNDLMTQVNTNFTNQDTIVATPVNGTVPFGNYTTGGTVVTLLTAGQPAGTYQITIAAVATTTFTGATTVGHTIGWTDDQGAHTSANALSALTAGTTSSVTLTVRSTGAAAITVTEIATGANATAGAMAVTMVLQRMA